MHVVNSHAHHHEGYQVISWRNHSSWISPYCPNCRLLVISAIQCTIIICICMRHSLFDLGVFYMCFTSFALSHVRWVCCNLVVHIRVHQRLSIQCHCRTIRRALLLPIPEDHSGSHVRGSCSLARGRELRIALSSSSQGTEISTHLYDSYFCTSYVKSLNCGWWRHRSVQW